MTNNKKKITALAMAATMTQVGSCGQIVDEATYDNASVSYVDDVDVADNRPVISTSDIVTSADVAVSTNGISSKVTAAAPVYNPGDNIVFYPKETDVVYPYVTTPSYSDSVVKNPSGSVDTPTVPVDVHPTLSKDPVVTNRVNTVNNVSKSTTVAVKPVTTTKKPTTTTVKTTITTKPAPVTKPAPTEPPVVTPDYYDKSKIASDMDVFEWYVNEFYHSVVGDMVLDVDAYKGSEFVLFLLNSSYMDGPFKQSILENFSEEDIDNGLNFIFKMKDTLNYLGSNINYLDFSVDEDNKYAAALNDLNEMYDKQEIGVVCDYLRDNYLSDSIMPNDVDKMNVLPFVSCYTGEMVISFYAISDFYKNWFMNEGPYQGCVASYTR